MATGLIVGESLFGVVFAGIVAASGSDAPLAIVGEGFETVSTVLGVVLFAAAILALYQWTRRAGFPLTPEVSSRPRRGLR